MTNSVNKNRFTITLTGIRTAKVTDTKDNKTYDCKVEPYHREIKGKREIRFQVRVDNVQGNEMSSGVIQVPLKNGKFQKQFTSNLNGRKSSEIDNKIDFGKIFG